MGSGGSSENSNKRLKIKSNRIPKPVRQGSNKAVFQVDPPPHNPAEEVKMQKSDYKSERSKEYAKRMEKIKAQQRQKMKEERERRQRIQEGRLNGVMEMNAIPEEEEKVAPKRGRRKVDPFAAIKRREEAREAAMKRNRDVIAEREKNREIMEQERILKEIERKNREEERKKRKEERAKRAEERKEDLKNVRERINKAREMFTKKNIDKRKGGGMLGRMRRQLEPAPPVQKKPRARRPKPEETKVEFDPIEPVMEKKPSEFIYDGTNEEEMIKKYKEQMITIRNYILFDEQIPGDAVNSKDLVEKQKFIRNQLGLVDNAALNEESLEKGFKIIDALNSQMLFVYDPDFEYYSVITGKKVANSDVTKGVYSYFTKGESRECVHCAEDYDKGDILMKLSTCSHVYHADCMEEYMYYGNQCPLCRSEVY